jgi:hypothetical protein
VASSDFYVTWSVSFCWATSWNIYCFVSLLLGPLSGHNVLHFYWSVSLFSLRRSELVSLQLQCLLTSQDLTIPPRYRFCSWCRCMCSYSNLGSNIFWVVTLCILLELLETFRRNLPCLPPESKSKPRRQISKKQAVFAGCLAYSSTLKMDAVGFSETSEHVCRRTRRCIPNIVLFTLRLYALSEVETELLNIIKRISGAERSRIFLKVIKRLLISKFHHFSLSISNDIRCGMAHSTVTVNVESE